MWQKNHVHSFETKASENRRKDKSAGFQAENIKGFKYLKVK